MVKLCLTKFVLCQKRKLLVNHPPTRLHAFKLFNCQRSNNHGKTAAVGRVPRASARGLSPRASSPSVDGQAVLDQICSVPKAQAFGKPLTPPKPSKRALPVSVPAPREASGGVSRSLFVRLGVKISTRSTRLIQSLFTAALFRPTFHEKWDEPSPTPIKHTLFTFHEM